LTVSPERLDGHVILRIVVFLVYEVDLVLKVSTEEKISGLTGDDADKR
jgi:hypothetical protein